QRKELTIEDADAIRDEVETAVGVSPFQRELSVIVRYKDKQSDTPILIGATPYYEFTHSQFISYGRFVIDSDMRERSNVIILGRDVIKALFPNGDDPIGADVKVDGNNFTVVGVMSDLGSFFGQSRDNVVWMP